MADYIASIRLGDDPETAIDPNHVNLAHHISGSARLEMSRPTGGHLLHMAVGMCIFNGVLELAAERSIHLDDLRIDVNGGFAGGDAVASTGITVDIAVDSPAEEAEIHRLITDTTGNSPISRSLEQGTRVRVGSVTVS